MPACINNRRPGCQSPHWTSPFVFDPKRVTIGCTNWISAASMYLESRARCSYYNDDAKLRKDNDTPSTLNMTLHVMTSRLCRAQGHLQGSFLQIIFKQNMDRIQSLLAYRVYLQGLGSLVGRMGALAGYEHAEQWGSKWNTLSSAHLPSAICQNHANPYGKEYVQRTSVPLLS